VNLQGTKILFFLFLSFIIFHNKIADQFQGIPLPEAEPQS